MLIAQADLVGSFAGTSSQIGHRRRTSSFRSVRGGAWHQGPEKWRLAQRLPEAQLGVTPFFLFVQKAANCFTAFSCDFLSRWHQELPARLLKVT